MIGTGSSCGACKFLRRRCTRECVFAPYFRYEQAASHFEAVHRVFGASNVSKLLLHLPVQDRGEAALTISYEALARMQDPVYGCVAHIFALQQQVACLKEEIEMIGNQIATLASDLPSCGSYQVTNFSNCELAFDSDDMAQENCMKEPIESLEHTGIIGSDIQMTGQLPQANVWEDDAISQLCSDSDISSQTLIQEFEQTIYQQYLWTENCRSFN